MKIDKLSSFYISLALMCLMLTCLIGIGALFFYAPTPLFAMGWFRNFRALHVNAAMAWILMSSFGFILFKLKIQIKSSLQWLAPSLFLFAFSGICLSYFLGYFGGREYFEFPPFFALLLVMAWILVCLQILYCIRQQVGSWPVHLWMWASGILFLGITFIEAYAWLIPGIQSHPVRDISIQWKSMGAFVGAWNLLVYGSSMSHSPRYNKLQFAIFILGLLNLMLGWAHHVYPVPNPTWIRVCAYMISMTEWLLLFNWLRLRRKNQPALNYLYLSAEYWIGANLFLALLISIPGINLMTHGTHITLAHAMGSTIGINTILLLAALYTLPGVPEIKLSDTHLLNLCLILFLSIWIISGLSRAFDWQWQLGAHFGLWVGQLLLGFGILIALIRLSLPILFVQLPVNLFGRKPSWRSAPKQ